MSIVINTNVGALQTQGYLSANQASLQKAMQRLASGKSINDAMDNAAGLAVSQHMEEAVRALRQGSKNANDGVSLVQTAQGAVQTNLSILQRMRELATQASTGTYGSTDLANIDKEFQALKSEIDRVANVTTFNEIALLDGTTSSLSIQVGSNNTSDDRLTVTLTDSTTATLFSGASNVDLTTNAHAQGVLDTLNTAIGTLTTALAQMGADQSNLSRAITSNDDRATNLQAAESRIVDADYAAESSNMAQYQIMTQSGVAMLSQANSLPQMALKLLS